MASSSPRAGGGATAAVQCGRTRPARLRTFARPSKRGIDEGLAEIDVFARPRDLQARLDQDRPHDIVCAPPKGAGHAVAVEHLLASKLFKTLRQIVRSAGLPRAGLESATATVRRSSKSLRRLGEAKRI